MVHPGPRRGTAVVPGRRRRALAGADRGVSFTTLVVGLLPMFLVLCGLVVDGADHACAERGATVVAAQAARAGADAAAAIELAGGDGSVAAAAAARHTLSAGRVQGSVEVSGGRLHVRVDDSVDTVFLGIIGVRRLPVVAEVWAQLQNR